MRKRHGVFQLKQWRLGQRLLFVHVQPGAANPVVLQGFDQCRFVDHRAASDVHQNRARLHQRQFAMADQVFGFLAERYHQADEIGFGQQFIQAAHLCAELLFQRGLAAVTAVEDRHVETEAPTASDGRADVAHADDTQGLAMHIATEQRRTDARLPLAGLGPGVEFSHAPGTAHQQGERQISGAFCEHVRGVGEHDSALTEVRDIIVVVAHRNAGHHFQFRGVLQLGATEFTADADQAMGMGQGFIELGVDVAIFRIRHDDVEVLLQAFDHFRRDAAEGEDGLFHGAGLVRAEENA